MGLGRRLSGLTTVAFGRGAGRRFGRQRGSGTPPNRRRAQPRKNAGVAGRDRRASDASWRSARWAVTARFHSLVLCPQAAHSPRSSSKRSIAIVARANIERAGLGDAGHRTRPAPAAGLSLRSLVAHEEESFDFIFIDADKEGYPEYLELSLALAHPGTLIVADNVIRNGEVANPRQHRQSEVQPGVRLFPGVGGRRPSRTSATAVQTVGSKGYDLGFALLLVI